jgi:hypothetical protein
VKYSLLHDNPMPLSSRKTIHIVDSDIEVSRIDGVDPFSVVSYPHIPRIDDDCGVENFLQELHMSELECSMSLNYYASRIFYELPSDLLDFLNEDI